MKKIQSSKDKLEGEDYFLRQNYFKITEYWLFTVDLPQFPSIYANLK